MTAAWWLVLKNNSAPGVDGVSCKDIIDGPTAAKFLQDLREELRTKRYPRMAFRDANWFVQQRPYGHLQRRSQRAYRIPEGQSFTAHVQALGLLQL